MLKPITASLFWTLITVHTVSADDLFSSVPIESVFGTTRATAGDGASSGIGKQERVTGAASLSRLLRNAGLNPIELGSNRVAANMDSSSDSADDLEVVISVDVDREQLELVLPLRTVDEEKVSARRLLELMTAGRNEGSVYFAYDAGNKQIELRQTISNLGVTSTSLQNRLNQMAALAKSTRGAWMPDLPAKSPNNGEPKQTARKSNSLVGAWTASRSAKEAYALQLNDDKKFVLAVVAGGKSKRSTGSFSLDGNGRLTLSGDDGTTIRGLVKLKSQGQFELKVSGVPTMVFNRR